MIASTHRMFLQAALCILAIGCMVSLFVSRNDLQNDNRRRLRQEYSESSQQLLDLSSDNDPNTAQPQPDANVPNAVVAAKDPADDLVQSDAEDVSSFWWKDIDYNLPWQCGRYKCYFQSMSNSGKGFLVFRRQSPQGRQATATYRYAKKLEAEHNITQFFSSPPFETTIPDYFAGQIARNDEFHNRFDGADSVVVQPSRSAPQHTILFKCTRQRKYHVLSYLRKHAHEGYKERLLEELAQTIPLVKSNPGLVFDFQFMIDLDGRIYHLDLDRARKGKTPGVGQVTTCLEDAMNYVRWYSKH